MRRSLSGVLGGGNGLPGSARGLLRRVGSAEVAESARRRQQYRTLSICISRSMRVEGGGYVAQPGQQQGCALSVFDCGLCVCVCAGGAVVLA